MTVALKPTLLIVDDEEGPRQSLKIVFKHDYNVLLASNGVDAIQLAREQTVDIAVCDIMMFGMSGVDLLKELKEMDPSIEVVMLTAFETIETARQALRYGASDYLNKPFDIPSMRAAVRRAADKRRSAIEFKQTNEQLHELQRVIQDQRVREEMAQARGEIYASVLHDLNSPLTVISGFVELINRAVANAASVEGEQLDRIKDDLHNLHDQISRCFEISRRYLSFLHGSPSAKVLVSTNQIIHDLRDLLSRHPSARGHQLTLRGLDQDIVADINGTDFLQILLNLTNNALQSSDLPHRVEVKCTRHALAIDPATYPASPTQRFITGERFAPTAPLLAIAVTDDGPGIEPAILARLFEGRFSTKAPDRGTGLGLSIVKRLLEEARGAVLIQTKPGTGSTFTVFLPIQEKPEPSDS